MISLSIFMSYEIRSYELQVTRKREVIRKVVIVEVKEVSSMKWEVCSKKAINH